MKLKIVTIPSRRDSLVSLLVATAKPALDTVKDRLKRSFINSIMLLSWTK